MFSVSLLRSVSRFFEHERGVEKKKKCAFIALLQNFVVQYFYICNLHLSIIFLPNLVFARSALQDFLPFSAHGMPFSLLHRVCTPLPYACVKQEEADDDPSQYHSSKNMVYVMIHSSRPLFFAMLHFSRGHDEVHRRGVTRVVLVSDRSGLLVLCACSLVSVCFFVCV